MLTIAKEAHPKNQSYNFTGTTLQLKGGQTRLGAIADLLLVFLTAPLCL